MMKTTSPEWQHAYLDARKQIDKSANHIWCITAILSAIGSEDDESVLLDAHALKYWMKSISSNVGEMVEVLDRLGDEVE